MSRTYQPVIIIGAPRSGTNMLRDLLVQLPGIATWDCDEINYIWRHGNLRFPSDEFTPEMATASVRGYIRNKFQIFAERSASDVVIEKTCANSLRVGFVDAVFPEAKYIYLVRDGLDASVSAATRWRAKMDMKYILKKARYVPVTDIYFYATRFLINRIYRMFSKEQRLAFWGPAIEGMTELLKRYTLLEVCALQWQRCVNNSERDFAAIEPERILRVKYETFVKNPHGEFSRVAAFVGKPTSDSMLQSLLVGVSDSSVGKGSNELDMGQRKIIRHLIGEALARYGYS